MFYFFDLVDCIGLRFDLSEANALEHEPYRGTSIKKELLNSKKILVPTVYKYTYINT